MGVGGWTAASDETTSCATALCRSPQRSPPAASPGAVWGWQRADPSLPEHSSWLQCLGCSAPSAARPLGVPVPVGCAGVLLLAHWEANGFLLDRWEAVVLRAR